MADLKFGQIDLIAGICTWIDKKGKLKFISTRQMNAIIAGANLIMDELARDDVKATPGIGLDAWYRTDDTGASSEYMAFELAKASGRQARMPSSWPERNHPHDGSDLGRCVRMLDAAPELREHIHVLTASEHGPVWNAIASEWNTLEQWYREDYPTGKSQRILDRINEIKAGPKRT